MQLDYQPESNLQISENYICSTRNSKFNTNPEPLHRTQKMGGQELENYKL